MEESSSHGLLQVRDLTIRYRTDNGAEISAVNGVSLEIARGEVLGILGESGCGKTTLALSLLRLLPPTAHLARGSILWDGRELLGLDERRLQQIRGAEISMIAQEPGSALNPVMRVGDQIAEVIRAHRPWDFKRCREEARAVLERVSLTDLDRIYHAYPHQLSGGQRQRIIIAQAIACQPALVIADEPTTALDVNVQAEILQLLGRLKERLRMTFLLISHNPATVARLADRIAVMYAGRIVEEGPCALILHNPLHPYTQGLLHCLPSPERSFGQSDKTLPSLAGNPPDLANLPPGCAFEPRCPERMETCRTREPIEVGQEPSRRVRCFKYGG